MPENRIGMQLLMGVIILLCLLLACYFACSALEVWLDYQHGNSEYEALRDAVQKPTAVDVPGTATNAIDQDTAKAVIPSAMESLDPGDSILLPQSTEQPAVEADNIIPYDLPVIDFAALREINPQVIGWLYCPDTVINYPVVQGRNNTFYLNHLVSGARNSNGCLFMDCQNAYGDINLIIYGHNMRSGRMFASLNKYKNAAYYAAHPCLYWITATAVYRVELFSMHTVNTKSDAFQMNFATDALFSQWAEKQKLSSDVATDTKLSSSDQVMTLVTCTATSSSERYAVQGKLVRLTTITGGD